MDFGKDPVFNPKSPIDEGETSPSLSSLFSLSLPRRQVLRLVTAESRVPLQAHDFNI